MKLKPPETPAQTVNQNLPLRSDIDLDAINQILNAAGVSQSTDIGAASPNEQLKNAFKNCGANLDFVAEQIKNVAARGESETARISAAKFIAEIHEVKTKLDEQPAPANVSITIHEFSQTNVVDKRSLINLVMPKG